jgi:hypothetical protein
MCATMVYHGHGYHFIHRDGSKVGSESYVMALTIGFGLTEKRGKGVEIEEIQFAMITLSP